MKINHLIVGSSDANQSAEFYCQVFGYVKSGTFIDTGTGQEGLVLVGDKGPGLLIVPFSLT